jgi:type IV secretion system protein TrbB
MSTAERARAEYEEGLRRRRTELMRSLGPTIAGGLSDDNVVEILVNDDGRVFVDQLRGGMICTGITMEEDEAESLVTTLANELERTCDKRHPSLEGELPWDGSRIQALVRPVVRAPILSLRKLGSRVIPLQEMIDAGIIDSAAPIARRAEERPPASGHAAYMRWAVRARKNVLVVGSTGAGKSTLLNAFLKEIEEQTPADRIVTIESTYELKVPSDNHVRLRIVPGVRSATQLLQDTLRLRPDRIIFGEIKDASAHDFLMALNTGHRGSFTTVHADSAADALWRLEDMVKLSGHPAVPRAIAHAINCIVFIERTGNSRHITELIEVRGVGRDGEYQLHHVPSSAPQTPTSLRLEESHVS